MHPRAAQPAGLEIQILLHAVPFGRVEAAFGERVGAGAEGDGDVGDDAAGMVGRVEVGVEGCGEDLVARVGEEDEAEQEEEEEGCLREGAGLPTNALASTRCVLIVMVSYNAPGHCDCEREELLSGRVSGGVGCRRRRHSHTLPIQNDFATKDEEIVLNRTQRFLVLHLDIDISTFPRIPPNKPPSRQATITCSVPCSINNHLINIHSLHAATMAHPRQNTQPLSSFDPRHHRPPPLP